MKEIAAHRPFHAFLLVVALAACEGTTKTTVELAACGPNYPTGVCATGTDTCFAGACVPSASLCSPTNLAGTCAPGTSCLAGGCVLTSALCSATNRSGICDAGQTCLQGACVAAGSLCSSSNTAGACPAGESCQGGICALPQVDPCSVRVYTAQPAIAVAQGAGSTAAGVLTIDGLKFKDLSRDGALQAYEDWRLSESCRAWDLVARLNLAQKIGLMTETSSIGSGTTDGSISAAVQTLITSGNVRQALVRISNSLTPAQLALYLNNIQELSESQPWGIPFVVTADPSNGFSMGLNSLGVMGMGGGVNTAGTGSTLSAVLSMWPQPLGLGAIGDPAIARQAGDTVRRELRGLGLRWMLGPMADLATEPRWARVNNTFGENPLAVASMVTPYVQGLQGASDGGLKGGGVAATLSHFPGTGANQGGMDSHSYLGRYDVFPGNNFLAHVYPFQAAVAAGAAAVMPSYSIYKDQWTWDPLQVGAAFSKELVTDLLKTELGFTGLVTSDWGVIVRAYGMESLSASEKGATFIKAGSHQLGQEAASASIQLAFQAGLLTDAELDAAAAAILEMSFKLGLFENPYTDYPVTAGAATSWNAYVHSAEARLRGFDAQKMAVVVLRNRDHTTSSAYLPIDGSRKIGTTTQAIDDVNNDGVINVYFDGVNDSIVGTSGTSGIDPLADVLGDYDYTSVGSATSTPIAATSDIASADLAIIRIVARKGAFMGLDAGVPLSFDAPFPGTSNDAEAAAARLGRNKVIDALRVRDGYNRYDGVAYTAVAAANPTLKVILVMHLDRPGIVKPFINGLASLDDTTINTGTVSAPDYRPLVSNEANIFVAAPGANVTRGVDAFLVEFGAFDRAVLDVVFNLHKPTYLAPGQTVFHYGTAHLPLEIPSTDAEVSAQLEDLPSDTATPSYRLGAGITYSQ